MSRPQPLPEPGSGSDDEERSAFSLSAQLFMENYARARQQGRPAVTPIPTLIVGDEDGPLAIIGLRAGSRPMDDSPLIEGLVLGLALGADRCAVVNEAFQRYWHEGEDTPPLPPSQDPLATETVALVTFEPPPGGLRELFWDYEPSPEGIRFRTPEPVEYFDLSDVGEQLVRTAHFVNACSAIVDLPDVKEWLAGMQKAGHSVLPTVPYQE